jgi:CHAD domain-containing protein
VTFRIRAEESLTEGIRRGLRREAGKAVDWLAGSDHTSMEAVHTVRKRFKKARALLKLARSGLGKRRYRGENDRYRAAGKPLTEVRDAEVLAEVFKELTEHHADELADAVLPIRSALEAQCVETRHCVLDDVALLEDLAESVAKGRRRARKMTFRCDGLGLLTDGVGRAYERARRTFEVALADADTENLHEWRKRVKDLLYQLRLLAGADSGDWAERIERTKELADALGDDHDLAVLDDFLRQHDLPVETVAPLIERRRAELQEQARNLGRVVHDEAPSEFLHRFRSDWKRRRSGELEPIHEEAANQ